MVNKTKYYALPSYTAVTTNPDEYVAAWRKMAEPLERELGVTLEGFDPTFRFRKGNAQGDGSVSIDLPLWFVRDLGNRLGYHESSERQ